MTGAVAREPAMDDPVAQGERGGDNQSRAVAASPSLPTISANLARTPALKASISASATGASAIDEVSLRPD